MQQTLQKLIPACENTIRHLCLLPGISTTKLDLIDSLWKAPQNSIEPNELLQPVEEYSLERIMLAPSILLAKANDECKSLDEKKNIKKETVCKPPDLRPKEIPPYEYGYCKEPEKPMPMSCPPKAIRSSKGPCCHETGGESKRGGCRNK